MNRTEKEFLDELKDLCRKYNVKIVENWIKFTNKDGYPDFELEGTYFDGDNISIIIDEDLI